MDFGFILDALGTLSGCLLLLYVFSDLIDSVDPKYMVLYMYIKGAMKATLQLDNVSIPPELEDDFYLRLMSQLAPVLGSRLPPGINPVSPECSAASWTYLANLFLFGGGAASEIDQVPWALKSMRNYIFCQFHA